MKKIFTLISLMMLMFAVTANAQDRKTWDFTKGVSEASQALLNNDPVTWSPQGDPATAWITNKSITGELTAGGQVLKETAGLSFGDFAANTAINWKTTALRLQKGCSVTLPVLKAGQQIVVKGKSAKTTAADRGLAFVNAADADGNTSCIFPGLEVAGAPADGITTVTLTVTEDGAVTFKTGLSGTPSTGIEILSIVIDEGDKNIKKWDFSAFSAETVAQVCAAEDWTPKESASKDYLQGGDQIRWINTPSFDANNDLAAGGNAIKELKGLRHEGLAQFNLGLAFDYQTTMDGNNWGPYAGGSYIWVMSANTKIIVPNVKAGSTLKLGVETHKMPASAAAEARGFKLIVGATEVAVQTATALTDLEYTIPAGDDEYVDVAIVATKGCHLYYIEAEVKDETVVDKNPKLGAPTFDLANNAKIDPLKVLGFTMTFPKSENIEPATTLTFNGILRPVELLDGDSEEKYMFEDLEGTVGEGFTITFSDILELEENTEYKFFITKMTVDGYPQLNKVAAEGEEIYPLYFSTTGPGITEKRQWNLVPTQELATALNDAYEAGTSLWNIGSKGRWTYSKPTSTPFELSIDKDNTPVPMTEGLYFVMTSANDILMGIPSGMQLPGRSDNSGDKNFLTLGGNNSKLIIPQCSAGDEVVIKVAYNDSKTKLITIENGTCDDANTIVPPSKPAEYKIVVSENGDLVLTNKAIRYYSITVYPYDPNKKEVQYTINATTEGGKVLKQLGEGTGFANDIVKVAFPYYLVDEDNDTLYTKGAKGSPFEASVTLEADVTEYKVEYKKASIPGLKKVVACIEGEDAEGATKYTGGNTAIRASNKAVGYLTETDASITVLMPGTYRIKAMMWDAVKGGGSARVVFATDEEEIDLISTGDNMSEVYSEPFTITRPMELLWKVGGSESAALDAVIVYEYSEEDGVENAKAVQKAAVKTVKVLKGNDVIIKTADGAEYSTGAAQQK